MVISAYRNVLVNGFTAIGDGNFMSGVPAIAIQYRAENVALHNINIKGFTNSQAELNFTVVQTDLRK
ncbi:hypothetical protein AL513_012775 [Staphylococcus warneri]|nr:hypothetical protein AL513_012775 [Staphylococcus warneri]